MAKAFYLKCPHCGPMPRDGWFTCFIFMLFVFNQVFAFDLNSLSNPETNSIKQPRGPIPNIESRLGESVLLKCGPNEHELIKQIESTQTSMPVLVNWFKHYSLTRRNEKPIYAKYLANNIDYEPHVARDYENRIQIVDKINLNISNLRATDEALYECRLILFDKAYADSQTGSMFYLHVNVPPEFEYPNEDIVYFKPNTPTRLYCYAKGKPTPRITWYKNGVKLNANTSVLQEVFSHDDLSDIFEYRCHVQNIVGQIEHTVKVIRSGSLFFTEPLRNITVLEGTILNWPCLAQSNAEITYKWFKDSVAVQSSLYRWSDRGALFQDGMLYLLETYRNDSGLFECHAYTANKRIETIAYLNVLFGPEIQEFPSPFFALEGSHSLVLDCVVQANPQIISLEWFKDKYLISNTNKYQILANNSLLIRNVRKSDAGNYYCSCNNTIKKSVSSVINLDVLESNSIEITTLYTSSAEDSFVLSCNRHMDGQNTVNQVNWYKLNKRLPENRVLIDSNGSLHLKNLRSSDSGFYFCKTKEYASFNSPNLTNKLLPNLQRVIKLKVVQNQTQAELSSEEINNYEKNTNNEILELPLCPERIEITQMRNGLIVKWQYPMQTPVKIDYFQIYFREVLNLTSTAIVTNEWKTTESISAEQDNYYIDEMDLELSRVYEFQMVSFSAFSKSLPSPISRFEFNPTESISKNKPDIIYSTHLLKENSMFSVRRFMSQLDMILITIFLILLFILIIAIISFVIYKRSTSLSKRNKNKNYKDMADEWGFQSSSSPAATATFLSSSSSENAFNNIFKTKSKRITEIDCSDVHKLKMSQFDDEDHYDGKYFHIINSYKQPANHIDLNDDDYYFTSKKKFTIDKSKSKKRNGSINSRSITTGIGTNSSNQTNSDASAISHMNKMNVVNGTSSSGVSSNTSESGDCASDSVKTDENLLTVNTIKYNAKTNILHQNVKHNTLQKKRASTSDYQPYEKLSMTMKPAIEKKSQSKPRMNAISVSNLNNQAKNAMAVKDYLEHVYQESTSTQNKGGNHVNRAETQSSDKSIEYGKKDLDNSFGLSLYVDASEILTQSMLNDASKAKSEPSKEEQNRGLGSEKNNGELLLSCNVDSSDLPSTPTDSSMISNDESVTPPSCYHSDTHTDTREPNAQSNYFSATTTVAINSFKQTQPSNLLKANSALTVITKAPTAQLSHSDLKLKKMSQQVFSEVPSSSSSGCSSLENQYYSVKANQLEMRSSNEDLSSSNKPNLSSFGMYKSSQIESNPIGHNKIKNIIDSMNKQQTKYANATSAKSVVKSAVFTNDNVNFYSSSSSTHNKKTNQSRIDYV